MIRRLVAVACCAVAALSIVAAAPRTTLNDVEDEVMCVVCGVPLNVAESPQADRERALIRDLIAQGKTKAQVKQALVQQYGRDVLATPSGGGFDVTNWLVPAIVVAALLAAVAILLPRWRRRGPPRAPDAAAAPSPSDEEARRLDEDLARYR